MLRLCEEKNTNGRKQIFNHLWTKMEKNSTFEGKCERIRMFVPHVKEHKWRIVIKDLGIIKFCWKFSIRCFLWITSEKAITSHPLKIVRISISAPYTLWTEQKPWRLPRNGEKKYELEKFMNFFLKSPWFSVFQHS